jgi:hypothetical protein
VLLDGSAFLLPVRLDRQAVVLGEFNYQGIARLRDGVTLEAANADVARLLPIWMNAWPAPLAARKQPGAGVVKARTRGVRGVMRSPESPAVLRRLA